jgi:hypothetical protein
MILLMSFASGPGQSEYAEKWNWMHSSFHNQDHRGVNITITLKVGTVGASETSAAVY